MAARGANLPPWADVGDFRRIRCTALRLDRRRSPRQHRAPTRNYMQPGVAPRTRTENARKTDLRERCLTRVGHVAASQIQTRRLREHRDVPRVPGDAHAVQLDASTGVVRLEQALAIMCTRREPGITCVTIGGAVLRGPEPPPTSRRCWGSRKLDSTASSTSTAPRSLRHLVCDEEANGDRALVQLLDHRWVAVG